LFLVFGSLRPTLNRALIHNPRVLSLSTSQGLCPSHHQWTSWRKHNVSFPTGQSLERQTGTSTYVPPHSFLFLSQTYSLRLHCLVNQLIFVSFSLSRKYLVQLHSTPTDSNAADALVTAYHTLLSATLSLWLPKHSLAPSSFSTFVKSMWQALPSSSQDAPSPAATALGELLIDSMWSIDSQLDEAIADSKAAIAAQSETEEKEKEQVNGQPDESNAVQSRDAATKDKGTLQELVRLLLVRRSFRMSFRSTGHSCLYFFSDGHHV
jgi:hypothetical protein